MSLYEFVYFSRGRNTEKIEDLFEEVTICRKVKKIQRSQGLQKKLQKTKKKAKLFDLAKNRESRNFSRKMVPRTFVFYAMSKSVEKVGIHQLWLDML